SEGNKMRFAGSMPALAPALNTQMPEVEQAIRIQQDYDAILSSQPNEQIREENLFFADPAIFDIFSFYLIEGNPTTALAEPFSIVLTETQAKKYFGSENPLGQTLNYNDTPVEVTGIMADVPENTHLYCEFLISYSTLKAMGKYPETPWNQWGDTFTYILLRENTSTTLLQKKLQELLQQNTGEWFTSRMEFLVQPLTAIHWDRESRGDIGPKGNKMYVTVFLTASFLVLLIACFNFVNLTTSRFLDRMKEVGVRKVIGANRKQLIRQFLTESFLMTVLSLAFAMVLFELLHSLLNDFLGSLIMMQAAHFKTLLILLIGMMLVVGFFAGSYPALFLSKFKPVDIMKGGMAATPKRLSLRKIFVVAQFVISTVLILGTIMIYRQIHFMKNSNLGFVKEDVLLMNFPIADEEAKQKYSVLRDEFVNNSNVLNVSGAYTVPGVNSRMSMSVLKEGNAAENSISMQTLPADFGFVKTMGLELVAGRDFSREYALDAEESVLLNETAVTTLGLENPVGAKLKIPKNGWKSVTIVGVVKDFHVQSMHHKINPMLIYINPQQYFLMAVKIRPDNVRATLTALEETWQRILPNTEFSYRYLADAYHKFYQAEEKTGKLLSIFTALALFISCLGLFGMASFMTTKRVKEMGIRKVLGASTLSLVMLLSKQFSKWVLVANVLAWPIAYFIINQWLRNFAYHTSVSWWMFVLTAGLALVIALLTVSTQAVRAALANPVESLRYE
ncbi:MAG: FtsX-like permease family protein, partial [bacterium]